MDDLFKKTLLNAGRWERMQKTEFQKVHKPLQEAIKEGTGKGYGFNDFTQDLFSSLYQVKPKFPEEAVTEGMQWHKEALDQLKELNEYSTLRKAGTVCDSFQSGLGSTIMAKYFAEHLQKMEERNPDKIKQEMDLFKDLIEQNQDNPKKQKRCQHKLDELGQQHAKSAAAWDKNKPDPQGIRVVLRQALQEAQNAINEADDQARAFGFGTEPGKDGYNDPTLKLRIAEAIRANKKLVEIANLAGRFRVEARKVQSQKPTPGVTELTEIETGGDIGRLIPAEMCKLADEYLELEFAKKLLERELIQYKLSSKEKESRGPIVFCIDNSASMSGAPEVWSKAVALAMCQIATDQRRTFEIIHFNTVVAKKYIFEAGKVNPEQLLEAISYFSGGGTNFEKPLAEAFKDIIEAYKKQLSKADVIFITDDQCSVPSDAMKVLKLAKKNTGASLFSICVGRARVSALDELSDINTTISINDAATNKNEAAETIKSQIFSI